MTVMTTCLYDYMTVTTMSVRLCDSDDYMHLRLRDSDDYMSVRLLDSDDYMPVRLCDSNDYMSVRLLDSDDYMSVRLCDSDDYMSVRLHDSYRLTVRYMAIVRDCHSVAPSSMLTCTDKITQAMCRYHHLVMYLPLLLIYSQSRQCNFCADTVLYFSTFLHKIALQ